MIEDKNMIIYESSDELSYWKLCFCISLWL